MITRSLLSCLLIIFLTVVSDKAVIILVPGSFSATCVWHSTYGVFFKNLEGSALGLDHSVVSFSWSGVPKNSEIRKAGRMLAKLILSYSDDESIILIGHSHGGNVINFASQCLYDPLINIAEKASKITEENWEREKLELDGITGLESDQDTYTDTTYTLRNRALSSKQPKHFYKISMAYLLATPVDTKHFAPQMDVVEHVFNLYSTKDGVQQLVGNYKRKYPETERITNIELKIRDYKKRKDWSPSHRSMHSGIIASWILLMPFHLKEEGIGGFGNFEVGKDCTVILGDKETPTYIPNTTKH